MRERCGRVEESEERNGGDGSWDLGPEGILGSCTLDGAW